MWPFNRKHRKAVSERLIPPVDRAARQQQVMAAWTAPCREISDVYAEEAVKRRRRALLISVLEVALGDLVAIDGIDGTKRTIEGFYDQLRYY